MTNIRLGVDYSMWQKLLHPSLHQGFWQRGVKLEVIGSWHGNAQNPWARQNMENALVESDGRMSIATYAAIHNERLAREHIEQAVDACGNYWEDCRFLAIDVEMRTHVGQILRAAEVVEECGGRPVLYTANWVFENRLVRGDIERLSHLPLWFADYAQAPSLTHQGAYLARVWDGTPAVGHQYTGSTEFNWEMNVLLGIAGLQTTVDWNIFDWDFVTEGDMTPEEKERLKEAEDRQRWAGLVTQLAGHAAEGTDMPERNLGIVYNMVKMALEGKEFPNEQQ